MAEKARARARGRGRGSGSRAVRAMHDTLSTQATPVDSDVVGLSAVIIQACECHTCGGRAVRSRQSTAVAPESEAPRRRDTSRLDLDDCGGAEPAVIWPWLPRRQSREGPGGLLLSCDRSHWPAVQSTNDLSLATTGAAKRTARHLRLPGPVRDHTEASCHDDSIASPQSMESSVCSAYVPTTC